MSSSTKTATNTFSDSIPCHPIDTEPWTTSTCVVCCHRIVGNTIVSQIGNVCNMSCYSDSTRIYKHRYSTNTNKFRCASCNAIHTFAEKWENLNINQNAYYCSYECTWAPVMATAPPPPALKQSVGLPFDSAFVTIAPVIKHTRITNPRVVLLSVPHIVSTSRIFPFSNPAPVSPSSNPAPSNQTHTQSGFSWRTILFILLVVIFAIIYHQMTAVGTALAVRK